MISRFEAQPVYEFVVSGDNTAALPSGCSICLVGEWVGIWVGDNGVAAVVMVVIVFVRLCISVFVYLCIECVCVC